MKDMIGAFSRIPSWNVQGLVIDERPSTIGPDDCKMYLVQYHPDHEGEWYRLRPTEYEVESLP